MEKIRVAVAGIGNCASALIQGLEYYRNNQNDSQAGLMHPTIGQWAATDVEVVAAFDIDRRKVGRPVEQAIFAKPNCAKVFQSAVPVSDVIVQMGPVLDGLADHMEDYDEDSAFRISEAPPVDVARILRESRSEVLVCYLPVGSERAVQHYTEACLAAKVAMVNCVPVFIASDPTWAERFRRAGIPIIGDDIKSQVGATIVHRTLTRLFNDRGVNIERTYQLNTGGNTDFLNMLERTRLKSKKTSKTEAVQSQFDTRLQDRNIHIGPSDYVPWQDDNKVCFIRMEGTGFGNVPMELELRLSVEDSPNSAGVVIDAIRCAKVGLERNLSGPLEAPSAYYMKSPPQQVPDFAARQMCDAFINGSTANISVIPSARADAADSHERSESNAGPKVAVILAAGTGSRLFPNTSLPKPLAPVCGLTITERVVRTLRDAIGIERFVVCLGYEMETVRSHFLSVARRRGVAIEFVSAPDWTKGNGASALAAEHVVGDEPFILSMCDHLYDEDLPARLVEQCVSPGTMAIAIDTDKSGLHDEDDVMKIAFQGDRIVSISKSLRDWDAADTGVMHCTSAIFDGLRDAASEGRHGLADGVAKLAETGQARIVDVTGSWWIDVDTAEALEIAERRVTEQQLLTG